MEEYQGMLYHQASQNCKTFYTLILSVPFHNQITVPEKEKKKKKNATLIEGDLLDE